MYIVRVFKLRVRHHQILLDKAKVLARPACIVLEAKKIFYKKNLLLIETFSPCSIENLRYALCVLEWGIILQSATKLLGYLHGFTVKERVWTPLPPNSHPPPPLPPQQVACFLPPHGRGFVWWHILSPTEVTTLESKSWFIYWQTNFCCSEIINLGDWILRMKNDEKTGSKYSLKYITWIFLHSFQTRGK